MQHSLHRRHFKIKQISVGQSSAENLHDQLEHRNLHGELFLPHVKLQIVPIPTDITAESRYR